MENSEKKFDNLILNIGGWNPELKDTDLLTNAIMIRIAENKRNSKPMLLIWIRTFSTTAAVFLIGLYMFQNPINRMNTTSTNHARNFEKSFYIDASCIQRNKNQKVNFLKSYFCYLKHNSLRNKKFLSYYEQFNNYKNENYD